MKVARTPRYLQLRVTTLIVATITLLLSFFLFVPAIVALRAGIAGLSIAVFAPLVTVSGLLAYLNWQRKQKRPAILALLAALIGLLSLLVPAVTLYAVAREQGVSVTFDPRKYIAFTGDSIAPTRSVVYKTIDSQKLHLAVYSEDVSAPKPTVLLVHGGGWQYGSYDRTNNWPRLLRDAGYQVISIEYRLASVNTPTWDKAPQDIRDAVTHVKTHAKALGANPDQLAILGQSAGGHLALLEAHTSHDVRAAVGLYAPTDLATDYELSVDKATELAFLGGSPTDQPDRYRAVSVGPNVSALSPPTLLIQGTSDDIVHSSSSTHLSEQLASFGVQHRLVLLPYTGHSFDNQVGGFATQVAEQVTLDFLSETLR